MVFWNVRPGGGHDRQAPTREADLSAPRPELTVHEHGRLQTDPPPAWRRATRPPSRRRQSNPITSRQCDRLRATGYRFRAAGFRPLRCVPPDSILRSTSERYCRVFESNIQGRGRVTSRMHRTLRSGGAGAQGRTKPSVQSCIAWHHCKRNLELTMGLQRLAAS